MATQLVQYMDLRLAIDNNPPAYEFGPGTIPPTHAPHTTAFYNRQEELAGLKKDLARSENELITLQLDKGKQQRRRLSEVGRILDLDSEGSQQVSLANSKQESRPTTKDTRASSKSLATSGKQAKPGSKSPTRAKGETKPGSRTGGAKSEKEFAEIAIQDEGGDPASATVDEKTRTPATRQSRRSKSTLEPVLESDYDNAFDLFDEQSWAAVPSDQMSGRFAQYRRLTTHRLHELEEQLQLTVAKTKRKVATLKAQFQEHKSKWEAERKILIEQVDQSLKLQGDAEKEADAAMTQLEDFITEQERLEQEEETKRNEILQASASLTPQDNLTPAQGSAEHTPAPGTPHPTIPITPESEQELQRLMQQTDDAKSARQGLPSSTSTSSSGSVMVGALLDVTRPVKDPSPDTANTTAAPTPAAEDEVRIVSAPQEVSEAVMKEVALTISPEHGSVAPLQATEVVATAQVEETAQVVNPEEVTVSSLATPVQAMISVTPPTAENTLINMDVIQSGETSGKREHVPSGQPMPDGSQVKSDAELQKNPVILIMPGQDTVHGNLQVQALIPGSPGLGGKEGDEIDVKIIPHSEAVSVSMEAEDGMKIKPEGSFVSREGSNLGLGGIPEEGQESDGAVAKEIPLDGSKSAMPVQSERASAMSSGLSIGQPVALDVLGLMYAKSAVATPAVGSPARTPGVQSPAALTREATQAAASEVPNGQTAVAQGELPNDENAAASRDIQASRLTTPSPVEGEGKALPQDAAVVPPGTTPSVALDGIDIDVTTPRTGQVQELNARLGTCVSAPPAVDMETSTVQRAESGRPKTGVAAVAQGTTIQLSAADIALSRSGTPIVLKITNKTTGEVQIREVIQGTVAPLPTPESSTLGDRAAQTPSTVATTFLAPDGKVVVTEPTSIQEASSQGLIPIEVHGQPQPLSRSGSGVSRIGSGSSLIKPRRSPIESPTKQVTFGSEPMISPRSSKFRRAKTADLAVVMESNLGLAQESALESMKRMMTDEENLKPKQVEALQSMRAAVKAMEARNSLSDEEVARTLTMLALASQMSHEAFQLGVRPDSIFRTFSCMKPQSLSELTPAKLKPRGPSAGMEGRESTRDNFTRETTLESVQEVDSETGDDEQKQVAEVDLTQLKELPILDIADSVPEDLKPTSAYLLPSEATRGSSIQDNLETPLAELLESDPIKLKEEKAKSDKQGELKDDGSNLEKGHSHISEREATQGGTESQGGTNYGTEAGASKQATEVSIGAVQKSYLGQSLSSLEGGKIEGATEEEIRASSAQSRASLREQYKVRLEEAKHAAEDRRSKSPHIELPAKLTVDDELILDGEEDDDLYDEEGYGVPDDMKEGFMDYKDPSMYEVGTSPPPGFKGSRDPTRVSKDPTRVSKDPTRLSRDPTKTHKDPQGPMKEPTGPGRDPSQPVIQKIIRKGTSLLEHPLLREYLKAYDGVVSFKEGMGKMFLDKDMMSAHQMTSDMETLTFDHSQKAMPQVEELTKNLLYVLEEMSTLINNILVYDREPPVSSLNLFSREQTQKSLIPPNEMSSDQPIAPPATRDAADSVASSRHSRSSSDSDKGLLRELQDQYNALKAQLEDDGKNHQEQLQRNTVVMMEMQDTINDLQRELSALGKTTRRSKSTLSSAKGQAVQHKSPSPETSVMFTRLDSDRNAKIMKKAVMEDKLDPDKYKEAVSKMDEYVSLPAQRLAHLVKKYVHHTRMKEIEEKVKNSSSINEEVFDVLDKMENLQNQRARQWAERMDEMGMERLKLANLLMDTLDTIEQESGIFLIKPMYSYRGRDVKPGHTTKLSRPVRQQHRNVTPSNDAASSFVPAPTPASNYRLVRHEKHFMQQLQQQQPPATMAEMRPIETRAGPDNGEVKIMGNGMTFSMGSPRTTWNMQASQPWTGREENPNAYNTPRILELDINRMLIGQNNISSRVPFPPTEDRLLNANQNTLRSYVTVNRPTVPLGAEKSEKRPTSGRDSAKAGSASGRSSAKKVRVSEVDKEIPASLPAPDPLPPITPVPGEDDKEEEEMRPPSVAFSDEDQEEPPRSPPGSSMYQSTKHDDGEGDDDAGSTTKPTRESSRESLSDEDN